MGVKRNGDEEKVGTLTGRVSHKIGAESIKGTGILKNETTGNYVVKTR